MGKTPPLVRQGRVGAGRDEIADAPEVTAETGEQVAGTSPAEVEGDVEGGRTLFDSKCSFCHFADSEKASMGPGLKGILTKESLPSSGRPATPENILEQFKTPVGTMPAFTTLSDQELSDLLAYLETL